MFVFAKQILNVLFPNAASGTELLKISSISILFILLSQTISGALQGLGKIRIPAIALGIGVVVKLILNILLIPIPQIGIKGAAISSVVCHFVSFVIEFIALHEIIKFDLVPKKLTHKLSKTLPSLQNTKSKHK